MASSYIRSPLYHHTHPSGSSSFLHSHLRLLALLLNKAFLYLAFITICKDFVKGCYSLLRKCDQTASTATDAFASLY
jgi:hypothetical protein